MARRRTVHEHIVDPNGIRYPDITVRLSGMKADRVAIVGRVRRALDAAGVHDEETERFVREALRGDYADALTTITRWVNVQ